MRAKFLRIATLEEAMERLEVHWQPTPRLVVLDIDDASGLVLAENVLSPIDVPPFDRAAYDGFAVRASCTFGASEGSPKSLRLMGRLRAGERSRKKIGRGECMEIATGAPIPPGADAVVMVEHARVDGGRVTVYRAVAPGENVIERGSDILRGGIVVESGKRVGAREAGAIATTGIKFIRVFSRPKVAVISTGSELLEPGCRLRPAKIYDANRHALSQAVKACGGEPMRMGIVADDPSAIRSAVRKALKPCDVVLISGGSSAGRGDLVPEVVGRMGEPGLLVHGLALKPGKPTFIAVVEGKPIFGLPGYPVSALMVFDLLVAPYLRRLSGLPSEGTSVRAKLANGIASARGRRELVPVKLEKREELWAVPLLKGSGAIVSFSTASGYIEIPLEQELMEKGETVEVKLFV
jgi:molybdenum cofactor synthesis domain-containing protein